MPKCRAPIQPPVVETEDDEDYRPECSVCGRIIPDEEQGTFCHVCHGEVCEECWETGCCDGSLSPRYEEEEGDEQWLDL